MVNRIYLKGIYCNIEVETIYPKGNNTLTRKVKYSKFYFHYIRLNSSLRKAANKVLFLVVRPLRGKGGGVNNETFWKL